MIGIFTETDDQTEQIASQLAAVTKKGAIIHLQGDLGAGKTTFARGFLKSLGVGGAVKSPTYNIVQPYQTDKFTLYHFDLYRISDPEELEALGIRDYFDGDSICLLEWPEKGISLPVPDISIKLGYEKNGRQITIEAKSKFGDKILNCLNNKNGIVS